MFEAKKADIGQFVIVWHALCYSYNQPQPWWQRQTRNKQWEETKMDAMAATMTIGYLASMVVFMLGRFSR